MINEVSDNNPYLSPGTTSENQVKTNAEFGDFVYDKEASIVYVPKRCKLGPVCIECRSTDSLIEKVSKIKYIGSGPYIFLGISPIIPFLFIFSCIYLFYRKIYKHEKILIKHHKCSRCERRYVKCTNISRALFTLAVISFLLPFIEYFIQLPHVVGVIISLFGLGFFVLLIASFFVRLARGSTLKVAMRKPSSDLYKLKGFNFVQ